MKQCERCRGTGWEPVPVEQNRVRCVQECPCSVGRDRAQKLGKIPLRYRMARIGTLKPCSDLSTCFSPVEVQDTVIRQLKENPENSYVFFGPTGCGKTTYLAALYRHAVETQRRACFYTQMADLVRQLRDLELGREILPYLTRVTLREAVNNRLRPRVFLDECDKLNVSEFARSAVHEIIDECYKLAGNDSTGVQLVLATNLNRAEFSEMWGAPVLRRVEAVCEVVDFFDARVGKERELLPAGDKF